MKNFKNHNKIIIFSEIEWTFLKQRHQMIAEYLQSLGYEVHFVQKVPSRIPSVKIIFNMVKSLVAGRLKKSSKDENKANLINLHYSRFLPQTNILFGLYNKYIAASYYAKMAKNGVAYIFTPSAIEMVKKRNNNNFKIVFDIVHNWWDMPWASAMSRESATNLLRKADGVICDSKPLANYLASKNAVNINIVLPGVNENWIRKGKPISSIVKSDTNSYRIVFFGNLRENNDLQLIKLLSLSGVKIVAYGNVTPKASSYLEGLIEFKAALSQDKLLEEVRNYDFTLLPYANDEFSKWISPAKYFEVLALGLPIISRSKLSHMPGWDELCHTIIFDSKNDKSKIKAQLKTIAERHSEKQLSEYAISIAKKHLWSNQLNKIAKIIEECIAKEN